MAEKICPGPVCGGNGGTGGVSEAVCVHTKRIYDSCKSKECARDLRVYLCREAQELLNTGNVASVRPRQAELLCAKIDVEPVLFNRGFYTIDVRFFYKVEVELSCAVGRPRIFDGLAIHDKRTILYGSEGAVRIFSSRFVDDGMDLQMAQRSNLPICMVEVVDPVLLSAKIIPPEQSNCCCCDLCDVPVPISRCFAGEDIALGDDGYQLVVTLGQFSIIRLERDTQLLMPAYDVCMPRRDCSGSGAEDETDPCSVFASFQFPVEEFFPPEKRSCCHAESGHNNAENGCGCRRSACDK